MEQHPVPQNVTSFQFKLVGDITLKQFAYVAGGIILAYIFYRVPILPIFLRYPLAIIFALLGFGLAFVPVEQRPMDRWLIAFFKSVYMPTQFVWRKDNPVPEALLNMPIMQTIPTTQTPIMPPKSPMAQPPPKPQPVTPPPPPPPAKPAPRPPEPKSEPVKPAPPSVQPFKPPKPQPNTWTIGAPPGKAKPTFNTQTPQVSVTGKKVVFADQPKPIQQNTNQSQQLAKLKSDYQQLEQKLADQMKTMHDEAGKGTMTQARVAELQELIMQLMSEKDRLSKDLEKTRQELTRSTQPKPVKPVMETPSEPPRTSVKMVAAQTAKQSGMLHLTEYPNIITGIVKDSRGSLLPNIIVTIKDRESVPVRAFKTNKIGQFASSTQLTSGTYTIELEDPKKVFRFDTIEVTLNDQVLPALEIFATSEKDAIRQKLAQEIFGTNKI
ncbi:hypothetical protein C4579_04300 [Candidatus Microgenomates bacterium]|nr:MAG: hypothetical protein C4579_04300 [Candidatus Microgenomates bacterium]